MYRKKKLLILASGTETGGGSGFENLVRTCTMADILAVVSNHENGGVRRRAKVLNIPFIYFPKPWTAEKYAAIFEKTGAEFTALSGWMKFVSGLNPRTTFNIHPGPLHDHHFFGGKGMHGDAVHQAVMEVHDRGLIDHSAVTMHFVTDRYDRGPIFFEHMVSIQSGDTWEKLRARVNKAEHKYQPLYTDAVLAGLIHWDGQNPGSLVRANEHQILSRIYGRMYQRA